MTGGGRYQIETDGLRAGLSARVGMGTGLGSKDRNRIAIGLRVELGLLSGTGAQPWVG